MSVGGATAFFLRTWCGKRELCLCGESKLLRNEVVLVLVLLVVRLATPSMPETSFPKLVFPHMSVYGPHPSCMTKP